MIKNGERWLIKENYKKISFFKEHLNKNLMEALFQKKIN